MTYTTESDIEAMAEAAYAEYIRPTEQLHNEKLPWAGLPESDKQTFRCQIKAAIKASPVHKELERLRAENERLREALKCHHQWHLDSGDIVFDIGNGETITLNNAAEYSDSIMCEQTLQALQQKGGGDD